MSTKQRDTLFQQWRATIGRDGQDLPTLKQVGKRALADSGVRDDATLKCMIEAEVAARQRELEKRSPSQHSSTATPELRPNFRTEYPEPVHIATSEENKQEFDLLAAKIGDSLERCNDAESSAIIKKMKSLQELSPEAISADVLNAFQNRFKAMRAHIRELTLEIASLEQKAVTAAGDGSLDQLSLTMRRLAAINVAHPSLLDETGIEQIRRAVSSATEEHNQHQLTTKTLLERQRSITAEIKSLSIIIHDFHRVACKTPNTSEEFQKAEAAYFQAIQRVRNLDHEWFSGVVLDLADLLAEWTVTPPGAESQIDRFLDSISTGLANIRSKIRQISIEQEPKDGHTG